MSTLPLLIGLVVIIVILLSLCLLINQSRVKNTVELKKMRQRMRVAVNALSVNMGVDEELVAKELRQGRPIDIATVARLIQSSENFNEQVTASNEINEPAPKL